MEFKINNYTDGVHNLLLNESAERLGLKEPFNGEVEVDIRMDKSPTQIVLDCEVFAEAGFVCDRCAEDYNIELENKFRMTYLFGHDKEVEDIDIKVLPPEAVKIDLSSEVMEYAYLAVPMKKLCSEECEGLCPHCGKNRNSEKCSCEDEQINPIWEDLLKLKNKNN